MIAAKRQIAIYPLRFDNIEVLGHRVKETDASWTGLDWQRSRLERDDKLKVWYWPVSGLSGLV